MSLNAKAKDLPPDGPIKGMRVLPLSKGSRKRMIQFVLFRLILSLGRLPACSPALQGEGKAEGSGGGGVKETGLGANRIMEHLIGSRNAIMILLV